jgi:hypothetical protein
MGQRFLVTYLIEATEAIAARNTLEAAERLQSQEPDAKIVSIVPEVNGAAPDDDELDSEDFDDDGYGHGI